MEDGTLVFPIQYIDSDRMPHAGIMYSKDRGRIGQLILRHVRTQLKHKLLRLGQVY